MRACERPQLVFVGHAETLPGELWTRVYPDGEETTFLFDSTMEASVFARHWDADLSFDMPPCVDPRRALDYQNVRESMYVSRAALGTTMDDGRRLRPNAVLSFDHLRPEDMGVMPR